MFLRRVSFFVLFPLLAYLVGELSAPALTAVEPQEIEEADDEEYGCGAAEAGG